MRLADLFRRREEKEPTKQFGPYLLKAESDSYGDYISLRIYASLEGKTIGGANFETAPGAKEATVISSTDTYVYDPHKRKGVASAMYRFAEELGYTVIPSNEQTPDGELFFSNRK